MSSALKVAIVGGGIGGVAAAAALQQKGIKTHIFERAEAFGEIGAGIQVTPNAVKVLKQLGLEKELQEVGFLPEALVGRNWENANELFRIPLKNECPRLYGAHFYHVHRADLHRILSSKIGDSEVTFSTACIGARQDGQKVVAEFQDGTEFEADLLIAADGVRSVIREGLFGDDKPRFTGHMCYRALVPYDEMPSYVAPESSFWLGPQGHVVTYYVSCGKEVNIVAVKETDQWVEESWNARSTREEMLAAFEGWHDNLIRLFERADDVYRWGLFDRDPIETWTSGRITLLGDAAHPMLPFLSQGAAMAIEDAYVLASALGSLPGNLESALAQYEAERIPRTSRVQLEARERGKTYHISSREELEERDRAYREQQARDPHAGGIKANWVYAYNATDFQPVRPVSEMS